MPAIFRHWAIANAFDYANRASNGGSPTTTTTTSTTTTTEAPPPPTSSNQSSTSDGFVHHANFVWYEDWDDGGADMPVPNQPYHRYVELSPLLPFGMMLIISTIIFLLILFRRWPGLVAGIVAGCLTSMSIYLLLLTLREQRLVYE